MLKFNHNNATHISDNFSFSYFKKSTGVTQLQVYIGNRCIFDGIVEDADKFISDNFFHTAFNFKNEPEPIVPTIEVMPTVEKTVTVKEETNVKKSSKKKR